MQIGLRFLNNYEHNNKQVLFMYINILVALNITILQQVTEY